MTDQQPALERKDAPVASQDLAGPDAPAAAPASQVAGLPRIVIVGGGAGGLELVTRLGDKLGKYGKADVTLVDRARTHLWKPLLDEVAAGSMDLDDHALDYLAQAHWHHFHYRVGELIGLDRRAKEIRLGATHDEEGRLVTPERAVPYEILVLAIGSRSNDFGTPASRSTPSRCTPPSRRPASTAAWSMPACAPMPRPSPSAPASSTSRSSAPVRPAPSSRPSCTAPPGPSSPTASTGSTPTRTSRSP
jgi:Pyridine nucleotide-disulphide oxidoreductase